jgi:transposase
MGGPGTRYSTEFKTEAVSQVIDRGYSVSEVAKRIGVSEHSLYQWVKRARTRAEQSGDSTDLAAENARLKRELKRAQEERDILRKAAAYFAKESERGTPS